MKTVAVVIPTVEGREQLVGRAVASVASQTRPPTLTLVGHDREREGPAVMRNRLATAALRMGCEWVAFLDDDDEMLPRHLEVLLGASTGVDVVYSRPEPCRVGWNPAVPCADNLEMLRQVNWVPITTLIRLRAFVNAGMFSVKDVYEDWGLWVRMVESGATFRSVDEVTWRYNWGEWQHRTDVYDGARQN